MRRRHDRRRPGICIIVEVHSGKRVALPACRSWSASSTSRAIATTARSPWPANRAPAAGAALPHQDSQLFAQGHADRAFRELAAGSQRKLARAFRISRADDGIHRDGGSARRHVRHQSVRLLHRSGRRRIIRSSIRASSTRNWRLISSRKSPGRCCGSFSPRSRASRRTSSTSSSRSISVCSEEIRYLVRMDPGVQAPEETLALAPAHAATPLGCWCKFSGISASRPVSSPAISSSCVPI